MPIKLFFHNASNTLTGTFPTAEQSSRTAVATATGANTLRTMDNRVGVSQASLTATMLNNTNVQDLFMGFFCSQPLYGAQTVGGGTWRLNVADNESSTNANAWVDGVNIYVWRPSTGVRIGTILDSSNLGGTEPTVASSIQVTTFTFTTSAVAAQSGDVIICELWEQNQASMGGTYSCIVYFDGTTETLTENTVVTNHASFLEISETLLFEQKPMVSVGHPFMF